MRHETGPYHPEQPDRIRAVVRAVREAGLVAMPEPFPDFRLDLQLPPMQNPPPVRLIEPAPAEQRWIELVHPPGYIERIRRICAAGGGVLDLGDTVVGPASFDVGLLAVGALLKCCDAVMAGEVRRAFAAVRPPGHHAEPDRPMGFCLFSSIAIAVRYLQKKHGIGRIAIVDFDVHHGNGTQAVFEEDPTVLFISLHQHPRTIFPRTGYEWETGTGPGEGFTLNIPFNPGAEDEDYLAATDHRVLPKLDEFRPELLLISAGFDAHRDEPLHEPQINLSEEGFELITRRLVAAANTHCRGRIISTLEGGYNLRALGRCVVRHLLALGE